MLAPEVIESAEKRVGETIGGKWHLDRVIGVGGMAAVYEATHRNRNRVAIKLLHPALSLEEGTRHRFLREGYVANTIRHSGAVQVLDDDVTPEGHAFLVMELLRGESVDERMHRKGGALEMYEALTIIEQLLDVLEAAHDQGVVHRDIKPDNIFLTDDGKLKVLDFGIARLAQGNSKATKVGSFMGTPAFCAQEQARGRWDEVDHRTDLYSVGATLFTCLTGTHVHEAETSSEQLALAIGATARSLADVMPGAPKELVELVDVSLSYDKEDRFQTARAMRAAVQRVRAGLPAARKISTPAPPSGTKTYGPVDLDPDSIRPNTAVAGPRLTRLLVGVAVALALALLIFASSRPHGVEAAAGTDERLDGGAPESAPEADPAETKQKPPSPSIDERATDEGSTDTPARPQGQAKEKRTAPTTSVPAPPVTTPPVAPNPSPQTGTASPRPQASAAPTPPPAPRPSVDDDMFDRRF